MARRLAALLLAVVVPPTIMLAWLGVRLLEQDRAMLAQREHEQRQAIAESAGRMLEQSLARVERALATRVIPEGLVRLAATSNGVEAQPADGVLWLPDARSLDTATDARFATAERIEFSANPDRALDLYKDLEMSPDRKVRAGALLRQARMHRRERRWRDALETYERLTSFEDIYIQGMPADLLARRAIGSVLRASGATFELASHAAELKHDLFARRWQVDRAGWHLTLGDVEAWAGTNSNIDDRHAFSEAADLLWEEWQRGARTPAAVASGRKTISVRGGTMTMTVVWRRTPTDQAWLVIAPAVLTAWLTAHDDASDIAVLGASGQVIAGRADADARRAIKMDPADSGLPWTIGIAARDEAQQTLAFASRRRLFLAGLAAVMMLFAGTSFVLWRVVQRDLAVARLQTDFVSAVSHEFRTPLASLRHIAELLGEGDELPVDRRRAFYSALGRNTERLQHLVESLLDFARMESGRKVLDLQQIDAGQLTARVVSDFQQVTSKDFTIALAVDRSETLDVKADPSSLTNALWNLLDNAVKYSPNGRDVHVSVRGDSTVVAIAVRDEGLGIPRREQSEIWGKFVRGAQARALGIKGTGLGLTLARHIVRAHGGTLEVESEEGAGSTFRIVLPCCM